MVAELDDPVGKRKEGVIATDADVGSWIEARASLTNQNISRDDALAAETLDAETLRVGIAPVPGRAGALF